MYTTCNLLSNYDHVITITTYHLLVYPTKYCPRIFQDHFLDVDFKSTSSLF